MSLYSTNIIFHLVTGEHPIFDDLHGLRVGFQEQIRSTHPKVQPLPIHQFIMPSLPLVGESGASTTEVCPDLFFAKVFFWPRPFSFSYRFDPKKNVQR